MIDINNTLIELAGIDVVTEDITKKTSLNRFKVLRFDEESLFPLLKCLLPIRNFFLDKVYLGEKLIIITNG